MNENIKKRLMEKVETVIERVEFIEEHLSKEIVGDRILRKAIYKVLNRIRCAPYTSSTVSLNPLLMQYWC